MTSARSVASSRSDGISSISKMQETVDLEVMEEWVKSITAIFHDGLKLDPNAVRAFCQGDIEEAEKLGPDILKIYEVFYKIFQVFTSEIEKLQSWNNDVFRKACSQRNAQNAKLTKTSNDLVDKLSATVPFDFASDIEELKRCIKFMEHTITKYRQLVCQTKNVIEALEDSSSTFAEYLKEELCVLNQSAEE